ncbi:MAG: GyrI-like domain-containing protein [Firmicutes bacterium]|nr:GyrI-like domain-containing protein [Bacillota bacterium]
MEKIDFKKERRDLYDPSAKEISVVTVPKMNFIMTDGEGDPNGSAAFQAAIDALFGVSYTLKFMIKKGETGMDYSVMPLEGLWWMEDMAGFSLERKDEWKWTLMIRQPEFVTPELFARAVEEVERKRGKILPPLRLEDYEEGLSVQVMHIGPFAEEGPTIERLHRFMAENGFEPHGKHHEIYLSDTRRAAPEKWRTVIRQPVARR